MASLMINSPALSLSLSFSSSPPFPSLSLFRFHRDNGHLRIFIRLHRRLLRDLLNDVAFARDSLFFAAICVVGYADVIVLRRANQANIFAISKRFSFSLSLSFSRSFRILETINFPSFNDHAATHMPTAYER